MIGMYDDDRGWRGWSTSAKRTSGGGRGGGAEQPTHQLTMEKIFFGKIDITDTQCCEIDIRNLMVGAVILRACKWLTGLLREHADGPI